MIFLREAQTKIKVIIEKEQNKKSCGNVVKERKTFR